MASDVSSETSQLDRALAILEPMIAAGKSEDEMVIALIQSGIKFTVAGRLLAKVQESKGMRKSAKERFTEVSELLVNWEFAPKSWDDVEEAAQSIADEVDATNVAQALSCIKRFAKEHEITLPEKPRSTGGRSGGGSIFDAFFTHALANPDLDDDGVEAFIKTQTDKDGQVPKYVTICTAALEFARKFKN